jgi:hypothetical protein
VVEAVRDRDDTAGKVVRKRVDELPPKEVHCCTIQFLTVDVTQTVLVLLH